MAPGQQPQHGVDDDERGQLAAREHVVADGQLAGRPWPGRGRRRPRSAGRRGPGGRTAASSVAIAWSKRRPPGSSRMRRVPTLTGATSSSASADRLGPQHHARAATVGVVVDAPMPAQAPAPQVVRDEPCQSALEGATRDAQRQRAREELREERDDVDEQAHVTPPVVGSGASEPRSSDGGSGAGGARPGGSALAPSRQARLERLPRGRRIGLAASRPSASASTTMRPSTGASSRMTADTAGTSTSPRSPPRTTYTSPPPARKTSSTAPRSSPSRVITREPSDLVPVPRPRRQGLRAGRRLQVAIPEALGVLPRRSLRGSGPARPGPSTRDQLTVRGSAEPSG